MNKNYIIIFIVFICLGMFTLEPTAQVYESCDQWATFSDGGFNVYNNIWGSGAGSQCLWANTYQDWGINADHPNTSGVKSYPNVSKELSYNISQLGNCTSSFSVSCPGSGSYATAYDIWYNDHSYEVMLWMNWKGDVGPIAESWDAQGKPVPNESNVNVGGHTWDVFKGSNGSNAVFSFLLHNQTNSATVDIKDISNWLKNKGWFGDANLHKIELGFELTSTAGGLDFSMNSYSLTYGSGTDIERSEGNKSGCSKELLSFDFQNSHVNINFNNINKYKSLSIYSLDGVCIEKFGSLQKSIVWNTEGVNRGVYLIRAVVDGKNIAKKIILR